MVTRKFIPGTLGNNKMLQLKVS